VADPSTTCRENLGVYHLALGSVVVTAVNDGIFIGSLDWVVGNDHAEAECLLREPSAPTRRKSPSMASSYRPEAHAYWSRRSGDQPGARTRLLVAQPRRDGRAP
jgi:hypothetical protein